MAPNFLMCSCARHLFYAYPVAHRLFQRDTALLIQVAPDTYPKMSSDAMATTLNKRKGRAIAVG
jgi:hypothetical protein